jgi:hypothetical protein
VRADNFIVFESETNKNKNGSDFNVRIHCRANNSVLEMDAKTSKFSSRFELQLFKFFFCQKKI